MGLIDDTKDRWNSKTPEFFEKIKKLAITIGTSATSIWVANEVMSLNLHEYILLACKYGISFAAAMGFTAQLTKDNTP